MNPFEQSQINEEILKKFEEIYTEAYDEGWNDALEAVKKITHKTISNENEKEKEEE